MGEIINHHTSDGELTRIFVWYPDEPVHGSLPDWQNDPTIRRWLEELRGTDNQYKVAAARYYHNPRPIGQMLAIARQVDE